MSIKEESNTQILKFANRKYNKANFSGKGFNILRKKLSNDLNILTSDMLSESDTIYNIRYDYNLNGQTVEIPQGCILNFDAARSQMAHSF